MFSDYHQYATELITKEPEMEKILELNKERRLREEEEPADKERIATARREMGEWVCDYLDDAGYDTWRDLPYFFKAVMTIAFPPLDPLVGKRPEFDNAEEYRMFLINQLRVLDLHINNAAVTGSTDFSDHRASLAEMSHLSR